MPITRHSKPILSMRGIRKNFGQTAALSNVDLEVYPGSIHALIGENGAGKSTLMKVLSGVHQPDYGQISLNGEDYRPGNPIDSKRQGISMVYQELTLAPHLTVSQNLALGVEKSTLGILSDMKESFQKVLQQLDGVNLPLEKKTGSLGVGAQQMTEIGRALLQNSRVLVLDEPTSALSRQEVEVLFRVMNRLRNDGVAIIYISHFLEEVMEISDRFTVLRDGKSVCHGSTAEVTPPELISHMIGREMKELYPEVGHPPEGELFHFNITKAAEKDFLVKFSLAPGEIMGIGGLVGSGRTEILRAVFGLDPSSQGSFQKTGSETVSLQSMQPRQALEMGMGLLSEDRKTEGLAMDLSLTDNLLLPGLRHFVKSGFLQLKAMKEQALHWVENLSIRTSSETSKIADLSGGNQQKVALGRLLRLDLNLLLLDEPTRGVDVGSKQQIYQLIKNSAAQGKSVLVISSYLPELFGLCHTLAMMHKGCLSNKRPVGEWTADQALVYATMGLDDKKPEDQ